MAKVQYKYRVNQQYEFPKYIQRTVSMALPKDQYGNILVSDLGKMLDAMIKKEHEFAALTWLRILM